MGGSILGANAVYETLNKKIKKKFYFLDNIDENISPIVPEPPIPTNTT